MLPLSESLTAGTIGTAKELKPVATVAPELGELDGAALLFFFTPRVFPGRFRFVQPFADMDDGAGAATGGGGDAEALGAMF